MTFQKYFGLGDTVGGKKYKLFCMSINDREESELKRGKFNHKCSQHGGTAWKKIENKSTPHTHTHIS